MRDPEPERAVDPVLEAVTRALATRRRLHLVYVSATDERSEREVDPFELVSDGTRLSLNAWCARARAERTFRLDRILHATVTENSARHHRRLRAQGLERLADKERAETAELDLRPAGRWLAEQAGCERVEEHADGTLTATVRGRSREWLVGLALSAGRHLIDVRPPELREQVAVRARQALRIQQGEPVPGAYAQGGTAASVGGSLLRVPLDSESSQSGRYPLE